MKPLILTCLLALSVSLNAVETISKRASEIDPRAKEHPEIDFVFTDKKGKPQDMQNASVDLSVKPQGKLVIWLMGHNGALFERLNSYGLHAIQVHYANKWFGIIPPARRDDGKTLGDIRLEAATGEDHSDLVSIPQPDGMMERAFQFVKWLSKEHPKGKWKQFLSKDGKGLDWDKVIVSGSSHGATTSARFAKHQKVDRVVCFCGPRDQLESWQSLPSATPGNRIFGFSHVLDSGWTGDHYCRSWEMMGLNEFGPIVNVDKVESPFQNTRRLITDADVKGDDKRAHGAVTPGSSVKDKDGKFIHEAVWKYLFNHPVDQTGTPTPPDADCEKDLKK
jgi:hypothetical protein|nr:hypothetical protein [Prosthecobacter sp.]